MRLKVFDTIDNTLKLLEDNNERYHRIEREIKRYLHELFYDHQDIIIDINSRVKSSSSLREKIIRNRFYIDMEDAQEILDRMPLYRR